MGQEHASLTPELRAFVERQPVFFTASAPLGAEGRVNLSPKGLDTFRVLDERRVAYLDLTGSGNETAAHLAENGRITFLFCAFTGAPKIVRIYGKARVVRRSDPEWTALAPLFPDRPGVRQIIVAEVGAVRTSCGYAVPKADSLLPRRELDAWTERKSADELVAYRRKKNATSLDGLPAPDPDA